MSENACGGATTDSSGDGKGSSERLYQDESFLRTEYLEKEQSIPDIASKLGVCNETIRSWMVRFEIPRRGRSSVTRTYKTANLKLSDKDWMVKHYVELRESTTQLANDLGVTDAGVLYWLRKHGIDTRSPKEASATGEDHYAWTGGHPRYYGRNWREQRKKTLERDEHTCQDCGTKEELHVHHVHKIRSFDNPEDANYLENLTTLCQHCHKKWEGIPVRPQ